VRTFPYLSVPFLVAVLIVLYINVTVDIIFISGEMPAFVDRDELNSLTTVTPIPGLTYRLLASIRFVFDIVNLADCEFISPRDSQNKVIVICLRFRRKQLSNLRSFVTWVSWCFTRYSTF